ncbi:pentapeptide repeat-containing protein [Nostoc sp. LPT]|uniref:pentapeptide repeat-containing protein n=1 Tax=Nostoc sp. LPT TaxID=2815387 RepID=UPI001D7FE4D1|nr:pentapeptide repeat-containing protein [Nostoc sp. LPT]MBN4001434.1 pentapeptide repeat-containing protein [Nostoc sp. LPT]
MKKINTLLPVVFVIVFLLLAFPLLGHLKGVLENIITLQKQTQLLENEIKTLEFNLNSSKKINLKDKIVIEKERIALDKDLLGLEKDINGIFIQALVGSAALPSIFFTWRSLKVSQEGQITERFTKAINQLGDDKLEVRLGGIYALERVAKDSEKDHWTIMEVLTSFILEKSSLDEIKNNPEKQHTNLVEHCINQQGDFSNQERESGKVTTDVQAALTVIGRRNSTKNPDNLRINLMYAKLIEANLTKANLKEAKLTSANLKHANLIKANFKRADLYFANFTYADLYEADFTEAFLRGAVLIKAKLQGANLTKAKLNYIKVDKSSRVLDEEGESFISDYFGLSKANFKQKEFTGDYDRIYAFLIKADLSGADLSGADLRGADLRGANLNGADLNGADLREAKNLTPKQVYAAKNWQQAKYDPDFYKQLGLPPITS